MIFDKIANRIMGHMHRIKMDCELFALRTKEQKRKTMYKIMLTLEEYNFIKEAIIKNELYKNNVTQREDGELYHITNKEHLMKTNLNQDDVNALNNLLEIKELEIKEAEQLSHSSRYAVSPTASPKLPSFDDVVSYCEQNYHHSNWGVFDFYIAIKKLGNFA